MFFSESKNVILPTSMPFFEIKQNTIKKFTRLQQFNIFASLFPFKINFSKLNDNILCYHIPGKLSRVTKLARYHVFKPLPP